MNGFRIYDKQENKYISEFLSQYYLNHDGKLFFIYAGEGKYNEIHKELDPDRYTVEMCSEQKETRYGRYNDIIWENDILSTSFLDELERVGYVKYDEDIGAFVIHKDNGGFEILSIYLRKASVEITGTIHDNGEENGKD